MPAPPAAVLAALRGNTGTGHWFFEMDHVLGPVRAWDGVGDFIWNDNTFLGVGGMASIGGLTNSSELQNHEVQITLNGVPLAAWVNTSPSIRDKVATIWRVILDEDLNVIGSRIMFSGLGNTITSKPNRDSMALLIKLRAPLADWSVAPSQFYTEKDQQRLFASDTGFSKVASLENSNVTGWSKDVETTGGYPAWHDSTYIKDSVSGVPIGSADFGVAFLYGAPTVSGNQYTIYASFTGTPATYIEETTSAVVRMLATATGVGRVTVGGTDCYIDVSGDVRTPGGKLVYRSSGVVATSKLRKQTTISANGAAGATSAQMFSAQSNIIAKAGSGYTLAGADQSALLYDNTTGIAAFWSSGLKVSGTLYVEETSGTAVTLSGSSNLQVGGVDCRISANGVLLSSTGKRIIKTGGSASVNFLRVWT